MQCYSFPTWDWCSTWNRLGHQQLCSVSSKYNYGKHLSTPQSKKQLTQLSVIWITELSPESGSQGSACCQQKHILQNLSTVIKYFSGGDILWSIKKVILLGKLRCWTLSIKHAAPCTDINICKQCSLPWLWLPTAYCEIAKTGRQEDK